MRPGIQDRVTVHYHRPLRDTSGWQLWAWDRATETLGAPLLPEGEDVFGLVFTLEPERHGGGPAIGLLPRRNAWEARDLPERVWRPVDGTEVWILAGDRRVHRTAPPITPYLVEARMESWSTLLIRVSEPLAAPRFAWEGAARAPGMTRIERLDDPLGPNLTWRAHLDRPLHPEADAFWNLRLAAPGSRSIGLNMEALLDGPEFQPCGGFGALPTPAGTSFRVFAPTASAVVVRLYREARGGNPEELILERQERGVWEGSDPRDLNGVYYTLSVAGTDTRFDPAREIIDPWARCTSGHAGRGLILRDDTAISDPPRFPRRDAILYELHLRDFTISPDSGVSAPGSYLGVVEGGTHLPGQAGVATGFDHLVELGVNTVQILPLMDFENDETSPAYNWGYMPVHFQAPDGWYASQPDGPGRVVELKRMIDGFHRRGFKVVLDVVLNHTAEKAPEKVYSFEGIVPGFYYRHWPDGTLANGSACGNELRTESPMVRHFVVETLKYWATAYRIDGFRFDLMGLIDLDTMRAVVRELRAIDPEFLIYGEPWAAAATPIDVTSRGRQRNEGFAIFNDGYRDAIKGGVFDANPGFIQGGERTEAITRGLLGAVDDFAASPLESVNFVECHDNATLWDRLVRTTADRPDVTDADRAAMHRLAGALVLLAPGIPFLHAGQEMLRTKQGEENSYRSPDAVNQVQWEWKLAQRETFDWYRGLIAMRRSLPLFQGVGAENAGITRSRLDEQSAEWPAGVVGVLIEAEPHSADVDAACLLCNGSALSHEVPLPPGRWQLLADGLRAGARPLQPGVSIQGATVVPPRCAVVLARAGA